MTTKGAGEKQTKNQSSKYAGPAPHKCKTQQQPTNAWINTSRAAIKNHRVEDNADELLIRKSNGLSYRDN